MSNITINLTELFLTSIEQLKAIEYSNYFFVASSVPSGMLFPMGSLREV
jgi:hypothetical protein